MRETDIGQQSVGGFLNDAENSLNEVEAHVCRIEERLAVGSPTQPSGYVGDEAAVRPRAPLPGQAQSVANRVQSLIHRLATVERVL